MRHNYDYNAVNDDYSCVYPPEYYDCNGDCLSDINQNGICDELEGQTTDTIDLTIYGCMDIVACNYDYNAENDDYSCIYPPEYYDCNGDCLSDINQNGICDELEGQTTDTIDLTIYGCMDIVACNYDYNAVNDDYSCVYPPEYYDCNGDCLSDINLNGICDELEVLGCTDSDANNYNADATEDDGSCDDFIYGCTDNTALNYNGNANTDDSSCEYCNTNQQNIQFSFNQENNTSDGVFVYN